MNEFSTSRGIFFNYVGLEPPLIGFLLIIYIKTFYAIEIKAYLYVKSYFIPGRTYASIHKILEVLSESQRRQKQLSAELKQQV